MASLKEELGQKQQELDRVVNQEVASLNVLMREHNLPLVDVPR